MKVLTQPQNRLNRLTVRKHALMFNFIQARLHSPALGPASIVSLHDFSDSLQRMWCGTTQLNILSPNHTLAVVELCAA